LRISDYRQRSKTRSIRPAVIFARFIVHFAFHIPKSAIVETGGFVITVLVVEDSPVTRDFLVHLLSGPMIQVIGTASNGAEAVEFVKRTKPDVITMDIHMPGMGGIEATRRIMETNPVPIVIVSANWDPREVEMTFRAIEAGALALVRRPPGVGHPEHEAAVSELVQKVRLMSEVKLVRRWSRGKMKSLDSRTEPIDLRTDAHERIDIVAIGASTGGPPVLQTILNGIPGEFPAPLLIVQHMAPGFLPGMLGWLRETSALRLTIASDGEPALPGHAYFAPDGHQMGIRNDGRIILTIGEREHGARPSVSYLFRFVAQTYGGNAAGILLTGMGSDGAREMKLLREKGAVTIVQNKETSAIYGMPAAAVELDAAVYVLAPEQIPAALAAMTNKSGTGGSQNA
jgi:two-component system chemotaxis response regulator CheB